MSAPAPGAAALAYAAELDALLAATTDDDIESRLVFEVGELLGGLSGKGFVADLRAAMAKTADDVIADADDDEYGDDGRRFASYRTEEDAADVEDEVAAKWHRDALAIMARPQPAAADAWGALASMVTPADIAAVCRRAA